ncbi:hypothetical protein BJX65DRAFT_303581 [Aspergillus insuetus]
MLLWPSSVRELWLAFGREPPQNERLVPDNILNGRNFDLFSVRLRDISQQLTTLNLTAVIGRKLFWPLEAEESSSTSLPYWPNLTKYTLSLSATTPAGIWTFEENPLEKDDEPYVFEEHWHDLPEHLRPPFEDRNTIYFRTKATPGLLRDFYVSAGHAAQRMPRLQHMQLRSGTRRAIHDFRYIVDDNSVSATWGDTVSLEPEEDVLQVWRDAAFQHTGVENAIQLR